MSDKRKMSKEDILKGSAMLHSTFLDVLNMDGRDSFHWDDVLNVIGHFAFSEYAMNFLYKSDHQDYTDEDKKEIFTNMIKDIEHLHARIVARLRSDHKIGETSNDS